MKLKSESKLKKNEKRNAKKAQQLINVHNDFDLNKLQCRNINTQVIYFGCVDLSNRKELSKTISCL